MHVMDTPRRAAAAWYPFPRLDSPYTYIQPASQPASYGRLASIVSGRLASWRAVVSPVTPRNTTVTAAAAAADAASTARQGGATRGSRSDGDEKPQGEKRSETKRVFTFY